MPPTEHSSDDNHLPSPVVEISWGELIDKMTILEIKSARINSVPALENIHIELKIIKPKVDTVILSNPMISKLKDDLTQVNETLWDIEDKIRLKETDSDFGDEFIELARSVYKTNDLRAHIKKQINLLLKSKLVEEKSYQS